MSSDKFTESLSAVIDGEAGELEFRRVVKAMATDDELREQWARKHSLRMAFKGEPVGKDALAGDLSFADSISQAIEAESTHSKNWLKSLPLARFAVAASVMAGVLTTSYLVNTQQASTAGGGVNQVAQQAATPLLGGGLKASTGQQMQGGASPFVSGNVRNASATADALARQRLQWYMNSHAEHSALNSGYGMMQFARMVDEGEN
ncbi:sigma-E factor negative regulatory protein RseA [Sinobacterium caligoides]|uniref:Sigma-E factor negative regulatory protein RseA n=1 Tax=Sinobacterium caligoides TaxID=933926 RepID=A0A3N2DYH7_9GAMM|nr:sigma-E factor negative regulatory protein [Sinobacterium caligoides]ROS04722.1 sigma-E factor negative regulatory protein RseA [Sinobacterium caligoides]